MSGNKRIVIVGAGIGGLTIAALLAQAGYQVTILEAQTYPGGSASTFLHKGYRFDSGATVAGGFQQDGPHQLVAQQLGIHWKVQPHDPAWVVHLPDQHIEMRRDNSDVLAKFPQSTSFWREQQQIADVAWQMAAQGLPFPPGDVAELLQLAKIGLKNFPADLRFLPVAFSSVSDWLRRYRLTDNKAFVRLMDATLLISAQTNTPYANALYGATALDLTRQGVFHVEGGIGGLAETLVEKVRELGGEVWFRQRATRIEITHERATGIYATHGQHSTKETFYPADFVIANTTPWSLDQLLGAEAPPRLKREVANRPPTQGAFVLHLGICADAMPAELPDHHQIVQDFEGEMGEGKTVFVSMSPLWDMTRAPEGYRAVTVSTHTQVAQWCDVLRQSRNAYEDRKAEYTEQIIQLVDNALPGFKSGIVLTLPGTPVTYQFYTLRHQGMVGGFPQVSLLHARNPRTGIANLRLVGDSIFPGQSTAGVTLGAIRVAEDVQRTIPVKAVRHITFSDHRLHES